MSPPGRWAGRLDGALELAGGVDQRNETVGVAEWGSAGCATGSPVARKLPADIGAHLGAYDAAIHGMSRHGDGGVRRAPRGFGT